MGLENEIQSAGQAIEKVGKNERSLFYGIMVLVLLFVGYLVWQFNKNQSETTSAFLEAMEKRDVKMTQSLDKVTEALNKNTEVMIEIKTNFK